MHRMLSTKATVLAQLEFLARLFRIPGRAVITAFARTTRQSDDVSHVVSRASTPRDEPTVAAGEDSELYM